MLTANEFIKAFKQSFKDVEYKATSKDGKVYKSKNWDKENKSLTNKINSVDDRAEKKINLNNSYSVQHEELPKFGEITQKHDNPAAPSSISANEAYDIAYANARTSTNTNLLEIVEKEMIQRSLKECGGNQVKSSAMLGITRATLRKRIDAHSIRY